MEIREKSWWSVILANQAIKTVCCFFLFLFCFQLDSKSQQKELQLCYNTSQFYTQGASSFREAQGGRAQFIGLGFSRWIKPWLALKSSADVGSLMDYDLPAKELMSSDLLRLQFTGQFYFLSPFKNLKYVNRFWQPYIALGYTYWNVPRMNRELKGPHYVSNSYMAGVQLEIHEHFKLNLQGGFDFSLSQHLLHNRSFSAGITYRWGVTQEESILDNLCSFDSSFIEEFQTKIHSQSDRIDTLGKTITRQEEELKAQKLAEIQKELEHQKELALVYKSFVKKEAMFLGKIDSLEEELKPYKDTTLRSLEDRKTDWSNLIFYDTLGNLIRGPIFPESSHILIVKAFNSFPSMDKLELRDSLPIVSKNLVLRDSKYFLMVVFSNTIRKDELLRQVRTFYPNATFF